MHKIAFLWWIFVFRVTVSYYFYIIQHYCYFSQKTYPVASYPCYHSVYETYQLVEKYYDPEFTYHLAAAQLIAELARDLADSLILPLSAVGYSKAVTGYFEDLKAGDIGKRIIDESVKQDGLSFGKLNLL